MRFFCCLCLLCALAPPALAQTTPAPALPIGTGDSYPFTRPVQVVRYNMVTKTPAKPLVAYLIPAGFRFTVVQQQQDMVIIRFLYFGSVPTPGDTPPSSKKDRAEADKAKLLNDKLFSDQTASQKQQQQQQTSPADEAVKPGPFAPITIDENALFFAISAADLLHSAVLRQELSWRPQVTAGTVILPVKMRFAPFDFSRDFALGLTVGPRWRISRYQPHYVNALFAFNANIVTVDSLSTGGRTRRSADLGALGTAFGLVLDFNGPQVGVFSGVDWLSRRDQVANDWRYQGRPWLSVGVGFTLFTRNGGTPAPAAATTQSPTPK